jgi:hypothetical protein
MLGFGETLISRGNHHTQRVVNNLRLCYGMSLNLSSFHDLFYLGGIAGWIVLMTHSQTYFHYFSLLHTTNVRFPLGSST